jgi:hypothetical protein
MCSTSGWDGTKCRRRKSKAWLTYYIISEKPILGTLLPGTQIRTVPVPGEAFVRLSESGVDLLQCGVLYDLTRK